MLHSTNASVPSPQSALTDDVETIHVRRCLECRVTKPLSVFCVCGRFGRICNHCLLEHAEQAS